MSFLDGICAWFLTSGNWVGEGGILFRLVEHVYYVGISIAISVLVAIPMGAVLANSRWGSQLAMGIFNLGRALPSLGVVIMAILIIGYSPVTVIFALVIMSIPLLLTNTIVGISQVDSSLKQSALAMGMRPWQIFIQLEFPLALNLIYSGFRMALVQLIATATIAAYVGFGGLGRFLIDGLGRNDTYQIVAGAVLVSALAMLTDWACSRIQRRITPVGLGSNVGV